MGCLGPNTRQLIQYGDDLAGWFAFEFVQPASRDKLRCLMYAPWHFVQTAYAR